MRKAAGHVSAVLKGVLFRGISIQIILGIVWMCCNFPRVPRFGESLFYMQVSRTLHCDEYTGILYPIFLWAVRRNHYVVYVIQLAAACASSGYFLRIFLSGKKRVMAWGCLALMTIPVVMQCHMAVLPCSFAASLALLQLSLLTGAVKEKGERTLKKLAEISLCWLALALLLPEYFWLGAVPVVLFGICCRRQWSGNKRIKWYGLLMAAAFAGMILGVNSLTQTRGLYGRLQKTPLMALTQRISWTSVLADYGDWPGQIIDNVDWDIMISAAQYADGMDRFFFPAVEQLVADQIITRQQVREAYFTMMADALRWHGPAVIKELLWDVVGYGVSPVSLQSFLEGRGYDTYSSTNYDIFLERTPGLSELYMNYGSWCFAMTAVLTAVLQVLRLWSQGADENKKSAKLSLSCLIMAGAMILWYTMRGAGMLDYKNTALVTQLWMVWTVLLLGCGELWKLCPEANGERDV